MKINTASALFFLSFACQQAVQAATCGGGNVGDGLCPQPGFCCSEWGYCGSGSAYCKGPQPTEAPAPPTTPSPVPPAPPVTSTDENRMIAYVGNWQSCPTADQLSQYTHIMIAFAVSYTWAPEKNVCSQTCEIATPPVCNNNPNPTLLNELKSQGKKIIVSFGGAGMGGSWADDPNDCWEYCFGRETQVVSRLTEIVEELGADGVDVDYEYFYEDNQNGMGFTRGHEAQNFLTQVTVGLRNSLPEGSIVTHAPMDIDLEPDTAYFQLLADISHTLDFIMPQYYNGITRPALDGIDGIGAGSTSALAHYNGIIDGMFDGDATRILFGFCISDCSYTGSNANANQAAQVMIDLSNHHGCNGGAFFWVAEHDRQGSWSSVVNQAIASSTTCTDGPSPTDSPTTPTPTTAAPTVAPTTSAPTDAPTTSAPTDPSATPAPTDSPATPAPTTASPTTPVPTTAAPTTDSPATPSPTTSAPGPGGDEPCCMAGYSGLLAYGDCMEFYHCSNGEVVGTPQTCPPGLLFDNNMQACNWAMQVSCLGNAIC